jgi:glycosyltransferase involved in cell wall biosynthesis
MSKPGATAHQLHIDEAMIRVAIVAPSMRILGGQSVQAQRLLDGWRDDADVDAWLVPHNPLPPAPLRPLLNIKYLRTVVTQLCYWPLLLRELRRADVVHIFSASYWSFVLSPLPAVLVAKVHAKPILFNYHSGEAPEHLRRSFIAPSVLRTVDRNVVPSTFLRDVFEAHGIHADVIPNVVELDRFSYRVRDPLRPRVLSTRNFEAHYNVACTLRAFARLQTRFPDATLTLVGAGGEEARLREQAMSLRLRHVTFVGRVSQAEMPRYYADADIYLQTPAIDNMPVSVLEAFASGLPVVSTDVGGVPGMLQHGVHGLLAPDDDDAAIAAHMMTLLDDPASARAMASAAFESCRRYAWPVVRDRWLATYRDLAALELSGAQAKSSILKS